MKHSNTGRLLSFVLALVMVFSMLPVSAFAADSATYTRVTSADDLKVGGEAVLVAAYTNEEVTSYYALDTSIANKITAVPVTSETDVTSLPVWTVAASGDGVSLYNGSAYLGYKSSTNFGTSDTAATWLIESGSAENTFKLYAADTTRYIAFQWNSGNYRFGAYAGSNAGTDGYNFDLMIFVASEGSGTPGETPTPDVTITPIADAVAASEGEFTVKGVVTLVDGSNIYVQDATGGICVRMSSTPSDIALGDTIIGTGSKTTYNGLPQLGSGTYEKSEGLTLSAKETTISALTTADICTYVKLSGLEVTEVYDNSGAYTSPNITVTDGTNSIQLYKAVVGKTDGTNWDVQVGDKLDVCAAVGVYKETLQLRNTLTSEITVVTGSTDPEEPTPDESTPDESTPEESEPEGTKATLVTDLSALALGDEIVLVTTDYDFGMGVNSGNYFLSVDVTKSGSDVYFGDDVQTLILESGLTEGTYAFNASGNYLCAVSGSKNYMKQETTITAYSSWTVEIGEGGVATIKSTASDAERNWIRYNPSSPRFSCYKSGQQDIAIYKVEREQYAVLDNAIADGDQFVIYYNKDSMVMSDTADGSKLTGIASTPEGDYILVEEGMSILTASVDENGCYTLTNGEGKYLTTGSTGNSLTFADEASDYSLWTIKAVDGGVHVVSVNAAYKGSAQALEVYNSLFTTYSEKDNDYYLFNLYKLTDKQPAADSKPVTGDQVVIYNLSAEGVLALQDDNTESPSITNAAATIADGAATVENGGLVFTVEVNGGYYRFYNETYGYLCSNGTGNNAFYSLESSEDADWILLDGKSGGYNLESRTAKFNDKYSQYLEYYAGAYKTYSMYNVTDYDIYEFFFYPVAEGVSVTAGVVNAPAVVFGTLPAAYVGADYTFSFTVSAVFGVDGELTVKAGQTVLTANADGTYTIPADLIAGESLTITVEGKDTKGVAISGSASITVKDEPVITEVSPAAGSETLENKRPVISATVVNAGEDATVTMTVNGEAVEAVYDGSAVTYTPAADMADGRVSVTVTVKRADGKETFRTWAFTVGEAQYALYFGQLHSHTTYSDGSGSLETALDYIASLPESANVDFVAFTDHSNYFDASGNANPEGALYDMSLATADSQNLWSAYKNAIASFNASSTDVIAIGGFEMTWSGGPGHINTFNTPGIVSRNNTTLNNKTSDAGMKAYYALLSQAEGIDAISQFNHPGSTFGTFSDFAYWDAVIDSRIYLVEVGNGEGAIGAGGYYPSYEYYTMALDKGWHVAPTNNQDNHKGKWGNANDARDVILTDNFSEEGIYEAIRAMRMYATEDKNLEITYTVNGQQLGSTIEEVPEELAIAVTVYDPDSSDSISKVEVIVNSGKVAYTWDTPSVLASGELTATLDPNYSYYYIRVTEGDGDLAVTAPVWVGETLKLGISAVETTTSTPVTGEELTINTTLFNSESTAATVKSLTYTVGSQVLGTDTTGYTIPASGNVTVPFAYTPDTAKVMSITVTAVVDLEGVEYTFTMDIELDVQDASKLVYIGIDASHYNEYVNGNYKDSMGNFSELAAEYNVRTVTLYSSEELIAACSNEKYVALILTAPSRRSTEAQAADPLKVYTAEELEAITAFNANGGTVILAGWSDHYENYPSVESIANMEAFEHMAATQNAVLEALGSSLRIGDDATYDDEYNGGQAYRLYFNTYNFDSFLVDGVEVDPENPHDRMYTEVFSHYGGASVYTVDGVLTDTVTPVVFGHSGTYSVDVDADGLGGSSMYKYTSPEGDERLMIMASEQLEGKGLIVVSGAAFMSNFEVQATIEDSGSEKNYSNYKVCENLLAYLNPVEITPIAEVSAQTEVGVKYTIEGVVTSNASGYDKDTAFFDCVYVQDSTGGICCFPVAGNYKIGDLVRVTGTTEYYQGEPELQVTSIEVIGEGEVTATTVTASQVNDRSVEGLLITVSGTVESFELANGLVQTIMVKDEAGDVVRVFIDGYITTAEDVKDLEVGCNITVTGLASYDDTFNAPEGPFPRIRVRDRADVVCTEAHVHSYEGTVTTPAGCETDGVMTYTCSCGDSYTEIIPATGHNVVLQESEPATCELNGYEYYACANCGGEEYQIILEATGHSYVDGVCEHCGEADPDASKPGTSGGWFDWIKDWIGGWFDDPEEPEEPTEPSVPEETEPDEPEEPTDPSEPEEPEESVPSTPVKPGWGGWFWFWHFC